jgi:hypothetical protein
MARAKCLITIDGALVMTSEQTGKRYTFTPERREIDIDNCDVPQFDAKIRRVSSRGCCGGKGTRDKVVKVFEIITDDD